MSINTFKIFRGLGLLINFNWQVVWLKMFLGHNSYKWYNIVLLYNLRLIMYNNIVNKTNITYKQE